MYNRAECIYTEYARTTHIETVFTTSVGLAQARHNYLSYVVPYVLDTNAIAAGRMRM